MPHLTIADAASRTAPMDKPKRWTTNGVKKSEGQDATDKDKPAAREERKVAARKKLYDNKRS